MKPILYGDTYKVLDVADWQIQNTSLKDLLVEIFDSEGEDIDDGSD